MKTLQHTRGQIERTLSQRIQALYRDRLGHQPSKVTCELFDEKLTIVLENSITLAEQLLLEEGKEESVEHLRSDLDEVIRPYIKTTIEDVLEISVLDLLSDATLETGRMGLIAILESAPNFRTSPGRNRRQ